MKVFLLNLLLALLWAAAVGSIDAAHLVVGGVIGYAVLWLTRSVLGPTLYFARLPRPIGFAVFFLRELVLSNLRVAWDVLTPRPHRRPGVVAVPLDAATDAEITLLANLLTLTPGTLSLDVSPDRRVLYVHGMFIDDPEATRRGIKQEYERRVLELLR